MSDTEKPDGTFVLYRGGWPMDVFAYRDAISSAVEVVRRDPAVLAELPEVKAIVGREVAKLREALAEIAKQKLTTEMETDYEADYADFEGGYDSCINRARAALQVKP